MKAFACLSWRASFVSIHGDQLCLASARVSDLDVGTRMAKIHKEGLDGGDV